MADLVFTIRTPAELAGAQAAAKALEVNIGNAKALGLEFGDMEAKLQTANKRIEEFTSRNQDAAKHTRLFAGHGRELKKVAQELGQEFPLVGTALRLLANPISAAIGLGVGLFVTIKRHIDQTNEALDAMAEHARKPASNFAASLREMQQISRGQKLDDAFTAFGRSLDAIKTKADAAVSSIKAIASAEAELRNAKEAEALALINADEKSGKLSASDAIKARAAVKEKFAREAKAKSDKAQADELAVREKEAQELEAKRKEVAGKVLSPEAIERNRARAKELREAGKRSAETAESGRFTADGQVDPTGKGKTLDQLIEEKSSELDAAGKASLAPKTGLFTSGLDPDALKAPDEIREKLMGERDRLQDRKAAFKRQGLKAEEQAGALELQADSSAKAKAEVEKLTDRLDGMRESIKALQEAIKVSKTYGEATEKTKARVRAIETGQALGEAADKEDAEAAQRGRTAIQQNRERFKTGATPASAPGKFSGTPAAGPVKSLSQEMADVEAAFRAGQESLRGEVKAAMGQLSKQIRDTSSRSRESLLP